MASVLVAGLIMVSGCPRHAVEPEFRAVPAGIPVIRVLIARVGSGEGVGIATTGSYTIFAAGRIVADSMDPLPEGRLSHRSGGWSLHAAGYIGDKLTVSTRGRSCVRVGANSYRGKVVFSIDQAGRIVAVNHVDMETYLAGVLARELYQSWHIRTYKAQAIAARTYAMYEMGAFGKTHRYDLRADQSSQVYGGVSAETDKARRAVEETRGMVLAAGPEGREKIFRAYYSACCGGVTNSVYVITGPPVTSGPLAGGQTCRDCASCTRYRWAPVTVSKEVVYRALSRRYQQVVDLNGLKTIKIVEVADCAGGGADFKPRPVWIDVVGLNGRKVRIRAEDLRMSLLADGYPRAKRLYSMNCRVRDVGGSIVFDRGRGFGHGVGLCQWGAQAKAQKGWPVEKILSAYYPGAKLFKAY